MRLVCQRDETARVAFLDGPLWDVYLGLEHGKQMQKQKQKQKQGNSSSGRERGIERQIISRGPRPAACEVKGWLSSRGTRARAQSWSELDEREGD